MAAGAVLGASIASRLLGGCTPGRTGSESEGEVEAGGFITAPPSPFL